MGMPETILHRNASRQPKWDVSQGCRCRSTWDYPKGQQERPSGRAGQEERACGSPAGIWFGPTVIERTTYRKCMSEMQFMRKQIIELVV